MLKYMRGTGQERAQAISFGTTPQASCLADMGAGNPCCCAGFNVIRVFRAGNGLQLSNFKNACPSHRHLGIASELF